MSGLPEGWAEVELASVAELIAGAGFPIRYQNQAGREFPFFKVGHLKSVGADSRLVVSEHSVDRDTAAELRAKIIPAGSVVFAKIGMAIRLNRRRLLGVDACIDNNMMAAIPNDAVDRLYLHYFLQTVDLMEIARATTVPSVRKGDIAAIKIPIAPAREQWRITDKLDELLTDLDAGAAALERVQRNLERYRASVLKAAVEGRLTEDWRAEHPDVELASELLERILVERRERWEQDQLAKYEAKGKGPPKGWQGKYKEPVGPDTAGLPKLPEGWCWTTFSHISQHVTVGHVGAMKNEYRPTGIPFLRGQNVGAGSFREGGLRFVSVEFHKSLAKSSIKCGDLLIVRSGDVGRTCVMPDTWPEANCSDLVIVKQPILVAPRFFAFYMNSIAQTRVRAAQVGVALTHFNTKSAAVLPIPLPPQREQVEIVDRVDDILSLAEHAEFTVSTAKSRASRLRHAILKRAFEGCLVPQDSEDEPAAVLLERIAEQRAAADAKPSRTKRRTKRATTASP